jgi:hypothetical protein
MHSSRESEETCRRSFDAYLATKLDPEDVNWLDGDKRPDYYLVVKGVRYAVEVTTIMEMVTVDSTKFPIASIIHSLWRLVLEVEKEASNEGALSGFYSVFFSSPITNFAKVRASIREKMLKYVRCTQFDDCAPLEIIFDQPGEKGLRQECTIEKSQDSPSKICLSGPMIGFKWEGEIQQEVCCLLQAMVTRKAHNLSQVPFPKILLLLNAYPFVDSACYKQCVPTLTSLGDFHTIFIVEDVEDEKRGYVLYTSGSDW